jgi:hypothetical protein
LRRRQWNLNVVKNRFADCERMPFLVKAATGLPVQAPTYWIVSSGSQPNTLHNDLRALMYLYVWAEARCRRDCRHFLTLISPVAMP